MLISAKSLISEGRNAELAKMYQMLVDFGLWQEVEKEIMAAPMPCPHCKENMSRTVMPFGGWLATCGRCSEEEKNIKEAEEARAVADARLRLSNHLRENIEGYLTKCGVSKRYLSARTEDFPLNIKKITDVEDGIFITGDRGTGKTHLAVALIRECLLMMEPEVKRDHRYLGAGRISVALPWLPRFIPVPELLLKIRGTFDHENTQWQSSGDGWDGELRSEEEIITKYSDVPLLVLDDLGAEKTSEWSMQTLYTIIDRRYREMRRTIFTSNLTLDEVSKKLDDRISSRIAGMCRVLPLKGKDRRLNK